MSFLHARFFHTFLETAGKIFAAAVIGSLLTTAAAEMDDTYEYVVISANPTIHNDYGLAYPITYAFSIPYGIPGLKIYKRYLGSQFWTRIPEKTSNDFFNGIEAVRFDYPNALVFVSVAFSNDSDEIHLRIIDADDHSLSFNFQCIPPYYDNRIAVVTATGDDWDAEFNDGFVSVCDAFSKRNIWFTPGIITHGDRNCHHHPPNWSVVQSKVNSGYIEIASHSCEHLGDEISYRYTGTHTGADYEPYTLTDANAGFPTHQGRDITGWIIDNTTDGSSGLITGNTTTTSTCAAGLAGGTDSDWDSGDSYVIDRYDEEIGGSKDEIIANLDLPYKNGSREYIHAWIEPYGYYDSTMRAKLGEYKYLCDRGVRTDDTLALWDVTNGLYRRIGSSLWLEKSNLPQANDKFDSLVSVGGIYHISTHPYMLDWSDGHWAAQHLDYIKGRTNLWYVGFGHLYLYRYVAGQNVVSFRKATDRGGQPAYNVSGTAVFKYPGLLRSPAPVLYQVRNPGLPPTAPVYHGTLTVSVATGNPASGAFTITGVPNGTYDVALKHPNHIADMKNVVVSDADVSGFVFTLWAGDADGDNNFNTVHPTDPGGDNDVDIKDYYTLYYQYQESKPVTAGYNADFNGDGKTDLMDYRGLRYGFEKQSDPGNWWK